MTDRPGPDGQAPEGAGRQAGAGAGAGAEPENADRPGPDAPRSPLPFPAGQAAALRSRPRFMVAASAAVPSLAMIALKVFVLTRLH